MSTFCSAIIAHKVMCTVMKHSIVSDVCKCNFAFSWCSKQGSCCGKVNLFSLDAEFAWSWQQFALFCF